MSPEDFARLESKVDKMLSIAEKVQSMAEKVVSEVKPTLDELMKSPILKMFGVKK